MTDEAEHKVRQAEFERNFAEAHCGRLFLQNQHQQEMIEKLAAICQRHGIDPNTGEKTEGT